MNFISLIYGLFLLSVVGMYWSARSPSLRLWILLIVSLVFYASLQIQYVPLLVAIALINFYLGQAIGDNAAPVQQATDRSVSNKNAHLSLAFWNHQRQRLLWLGIILNVVLLLGFKYIPFLLTSIATSLNLPVAQQGADWVSANLIAPLGISFFTFECIAYLVDVYRGAPPAGQMLKFTAYKLFFAKLISGPITRYHHFAAQLKELQFPTLGWVVEGLWLIASGAIKKALLADNLAKVVNLIFGSGNLERAGSADLWLATFAYGLQLYLDFSGYVDIARGTAILLGFNLPENFNFPYFSTSIADFWRRWHMTLGDWLRNYLYFPLGGSRQGLARTCLNLLIIMLIAGIWHGAAWGYVVWGVLHGVALVVHRLTEAVSKKFKLAKYWWSSLIGVVVAWLLTQSMVFTSWIFFRLPDLKQSGWVIQHLWNQRSDIQFAQKIYGEGIGLERPQLALLLALLMVSMGVVYTLQRGLKLQLNWHLKLLLVPLCLYMVWLLAPQGALPYIYFDF
ncbi:MAG: MBOAT family protein [Aphanothece sp. CMT-3BRIN-NPC111]|jgi:alginate O-acetyltransferase complex protein AlgI|nr:MBOAT family protein [Aphanothece sp. CMT-3BRIN-NPC111]